MPSPPAIAVPPRRCWLQRSAGWRGGLRPSHRSPGCFVESHCRRWVMLLVPLDMATFFNSIYNELIVPPLVGIGIICFVAAAVRFFLGQRDGAEGLARVGIGLFLIAFAPTIVTTAWNALKAAGGGVAG